MPEEPQILISCNLLESLHTSTNQTRFQTVDVATGEDLEVGQTGEICIRGPQVMKGYFKNEAATTETLAGEWLRTGSAGECYDAFQMS